MPDRCSIPLCKGPVPSELGAEGLCISHFAQAIEDACAGLRRETAQTAIEPDRCRAIAEFITARGTLLALAATSGERISNDTKMRILNGLLCLMNLRENLDRRPQAPGDRRGSAPA